MFGDFLPASGPGTQDSLSRAADMADSEALQWLPVERSRVFLFFCYLGNPLLITPPEVHVQVERSVLVHPLFALPDLDVIIN